MASFDWLLRGIDGRGPAGAPYKTFTAPVSTMNSSGRLIDAVSSACRRLASAGWGELLAAHGLDVAAANLESELQKPLTIDRSIAGFEDFALEGIRAIEAGQPAQSLLFHAFASPGVLTYPTNGREAALTDFPTSAEIEAVENYVYGVRPPSMEELFVRAGGAHLAIVVFAVEYRSGIDTVHRKHADTCYARCGVSRVGTTKAAYLPAARGYLPFVDGHPDQIRVLPCRYAPYIAALVGGSKDGHGPMRFIEPGAKVAAASTPRPLDAGAAPPPPALQSRSISDGARSFWVPLHKLFDGSECVRDRTIEVRLSANHVNEKIRRAHLFFGANGHDGGWSENDISQSPFIFSKGIAEFSSDPASGDWLLEPVPHNPMVQPAKYSGKPLTFRVPESREGSAWTPYQSSLNLKLKASGARAAPEYLHVRHVIDENGREVDLNKSKDLIKKVTKGGYNARHYVDFAGDGWIDVECAELALDVPRRLPAYSIVATPDFFPAVNQSDLMNWTDQSVPPVLLGILWPENPGKPEALSDQRYAANLELAGAGFDPNDDTMTAIVGAFGSGKGRLTRVRRLRIGRATTLPDAAAGVFAPGWDVSYDRTQESDPADNGIGLSAGTTFLNTYGLGSPFVEDTKLCAALSSFWPAVAPDITRTFGPLGKYATATPLTDDVIGLGGSPAWDGVQGPIVDAKRKVIEYSSLAYGDYVEVATRNGFRIDVIGRTSKEEYVARTIAMARVYAALEATSRLDKAKWSVLSFRRATQTDQELNDALKVTKRKVLSEFLYRFELVRHDGRTIADKAKFDKVLVPYRSIVLLFADPSIVLHKLDDGTWKVHELRR
ncbi:hypothetical protein V5F40_23130 [Xanthobacter sp. DSM 14520]|uniref:hypothetical protein n=1 Tax=Xanthobacter autotrophicus (strain ATCC BAA-1158 / Py2) TaxID=78245 RepID=UPI0037271912